MNAFSSPPLHPFFSLFFQSETLVSEIIFFSSFLAFAVRFLLLSFNQNHQPHLSLPYTHYLPSVGVISDQMMFGKRCTRTNNKPCVVSHSPVAWKNRLSIIENIDKRMMTRSTFGPGFLLFFPVYMLRMLHADTSIENSDADKNIHRYTSNGET